VKDIRSFYLTITDVKALTALQRQKYDVDTRRNLESHGITYTLHYDEDNSVDYTYLSLTIVNVEVVDVGTIDDVRETGTSPIRLRVDENVEIEYEPRNLEKISFEAQKKLSNGEFLHLAKGSAYPFRGRLKSCEYYFRRAENKPASSGWRRPEFVFNVFGSHHSEVVEDIHRENIRKATASGIFGSLLGAGAGFVVGLVIRIALSVVILPIISWREYGLGSPDHHSSWPLLVIIASTVIGAIIGYSVDYSASRQNQ
jgi:hypothetical protein